MNAKINNATFAFIALLGVAAVVLAISSLSWKYEHDTPLLQYTGLLIVKFGMIPYRDFFETSMPGVFLFHSAIIYLFGSGDAAFACVNLIFIGFILLMSWLYLARIDQTTATAFVPLYAVVYFVGGPGMILQRDFLAILPIITAMALVAAGWPRKLLMRQGMCGLLLGAAALIKPQLALGGPLVLLADILLDATEKRRSGIPLKKIDYFIAAGSAAAGTAIPVAITIKWLAANGALEDFLFVIREYLPLHIQQSFGHVFLPSGQRAWYVARWALRANGYLYLAPIPQLCAFGAWQIWKLDTKKGILLSLAFGMTLVYGLTPAISGQFWPYHYMPLIFFLTMTISLLLYVSLLNENSRFRLIALRTAFVAGSIILIAKGSALTEFGHNRAKQGRVDRIVKAMQANLRPGDTVQPIDWTDGVIHAMLRLELPIATPFLYDYHFHHNVNTVAIQTIRRRFMAAFDKAAPTLLVEAPNRHKVSGRDTDAAFPAFDSVVAQKYSLVYQEQDFRIFRKK